MQREKWEFPYAADKLLAAAQAKVKHHEGRLKAWEKVREDMKKKIGESGLEVDEGADTGDEFYRFSSNRSPTVQINSEMLRHLNQAAEKVKLHRTHVQDYGAWMEVLASQGQ